MGLFSRRGPDRALPDYVVVVSPRARRVRLTVRAGEPVRVTLPRGVPQREAATVVAGSIDWIERTRARVEGRAAAARERAAEPLPETIAMSALGSGWDVLYRRTEARSVRAISREPGVVTVEGAVWDEDACRAALRRWLLATAKRELPPFAAAIAAEVGAHPRRVMVGWPRRRWGSCSAAGDVRLSVELVFLPREQARAIVVHELAHLRVLDHSARFYAEVHRLDPSAPGARSRAPRHDEHTPGWALRPER